jgi:hypothetical protein
LSHVAYETLTACAEGLVRLTVKAASTEPPFPSATTASPTDRSGVGSSSTIVPCPCPSRIVAPVAAERLTKNVSSGSSSTSPTTATLSVREATPGGKLSDPDPAT